jgi:hypothetical protein
MRKADVELLQGLPTATTTTAGGGGQPSASEFAIAQASLDGTAIVALADAMADVQATVAAYGTPLIFKVSVEAPGLPPEARKALRSELNKAVGEFTEPG